MFYSPVEDPACPGHFRTYLQCKHVTESFRFVPDMSLPSLLSQWKIDAALKSADNEKKGETTKAPVEISCALCVSPASFIFSSHADRQRHLSAHRLQGTNSNLVRSHKRSRLDKQRGPQTGKPPALHLKECAECGECFPTIAGGPLYSLPLLCVRTFTLPPSARLCCYFFLQLYLSVCLHVHAKGGWNIRERLGTSNASCFSQ